ncbi:MAG: glycosyltransferase family 4 protein [Elioraea sp.]|nr:glycosyltransferase family 4 protein [Elioraea sp.]
MPLAVGSVTRVETTAEPGAREARRGALCLLVAHTFPPLVGGSAAVYEALARHADGAIAVLTSRRDHRTGEERPGWRELDRAAPYAVHRLGLVRPPVGSRLSATLAWAPRASLLAATVAAAARRHGVSAVCVCDDETVGWLVPFVRRLLGLRALVYCHGDDLVQTDRRAVARRARHLADAHAVIAASAFAARRLETAYGVPRSRIVVLPNGVDLDRFCPGPPDGTLAATLGVAGRRVILAATRLVPRKGVDRLIAALPAVMARVPNTVLLIAGEGPQRPALETQAQGLPVRFLGTVAPERMPALYRLAEVVVLPNREEPGEVDGIPMTVLEAQACGRPVIGGRAGGTPEAIADGETGLVVEGEDTGAIAQAVIRVLTDPALAARLAAGALAVSASRDWRDRTRTFLGLCTASAQRAA